MERPFPAMEAPPDKLIAYLKAHADDFSELRVILNQGTVPQWEFKPSQDDIAPPDNIASHIQLFKLVVSEGMMNVARGDFAESERVISGLARLNSSLPDRPDVVRVLIGIAEWRMLTAMLRKIPVSDSDWSEAVSRRDWTQEKKNAAVYFSWQTTTPEKIIRYETIDVNADDHGNLIESPKKSTFFEHITRPYTQISILQMNLAAVHDMKYRDALDPCLPNQSWESVPGTSFPEVTWYRPNWLLSYTGVMRHPELSWWNSTGKIIYAISEPNLAATWKRKNRLELETELTRKVMMMREARLSGNAWPASLPGIENSICKNEKWNYKVNPDGSATLTFSAKLDWTGMKGAQVPLQWTEPPPGMSKMAIK
jgi:hypothetical protein